jgi:two-component system, OmpR family, phosphate regulon response regulator PhoB
MISHLPPSIMVIAPENIARTSISNTLERNGFNVISSENSTQAFNILNGSTPTNLPNVIIANFDLQDTSAIVFCSLLKSKNHTKNIPIIITAAIEDNIKSLENQENGFEDYIIKPFAQAELIQKIKMILGKTKPSLKPKTLSFKDLTIDLASYKVRRNNRDIHLGPTEFKILQCFVERPTKIFSREELIQYIWGENSGVEMRTVDVHINRLRSALKHPYENIPLIKTIRSAGYCLNIPGQ